MYVLKGNYCGVELVSGIFCNVIGKLDWGFADKCAAGRDKIRTDLYGISDNGVPRNTPTYFFDAAFLTSAVTFDSLPALTRRWACSYEVLGTKALSSAFNFS